MAQTDVLPASITITDLALTIPNPVVISMTGVEDTTHRSSPLGIEIELGPTSLSERQVLVIARSFRLHAGIAGFRPTGLDGATLKVGDAEEPDWGQRRSERGGELIQALVFDRPAGMKRGSRFQIDVPRLTLRATDAISIPLDSCRNDPAAT
ncbi:MAG: hypothetical protein WD556_10250 [Actinomycetota bacterium]